MVVLIVDMIVSKFSLVKSVDVLYCVCEREENKNVPVKNILFKVNYKWYALIKNYVYDLK